MRSGGSWAGSDRGPSFRSAPAMNARGPHPVKIAARTLRSSLIARNARPISSIVSGTVAFTGGRQYVTVATWASTSTVTGRSWTSQVSELTVRSHYGAAVGLASAGAMTEQDALSRGRA